MSMSGDKSRLAVITKELVARWEDTKHHWQDAKGAEFELKYIAELVSHVDASMDVIDQLDRLTNKIRNDCE